MSRARRIFAGGFLAAVMLVASAALVYQIEQRPELAPVARGAALAASSGCFACHGPTEEERRPNSRRLANGAWRAKPIPTLWENGIDEAAVLKDWIANGVPAEEKEEHKKLFIQMPAYRSFLSDEEIDAVAAWILAEGVRLSRGAGDHAAAVPATEKSGPLTPDRIAAGDALARRHGCYACHGELGQGGVKNPASFKGYIPGFFGKDFLALTDGGARDEILHWIDHGRGHAIETGALGGWAKRFFDGQAIGMPAYRDRLTEPEKTALVDFLLHLNREGPLGSEQLVRLSKVLTETNSP